MKISLKEKIVFYLFKIFEKYIRKNQYKNVSGWWQNFMYDIKAFEFVKHKFPEFKKLETKSINTIFENELKDTKDLVWGVSNIKVLKTKKNKDKVIFRISLFKEDVEISYSDFIFVNNEDSVFLKNGECYEKK